MNQSFDAQLEEQVRAALGSPAPPNFSDWRAHNADAVAYLNPVVTAMYEKRRRTLLRIGSLAVAALLLVAVMSWLFAPQQASYAQAAQTIDEARTVTWTLTGYQRAYSKDRKYSWIKTNRSDFEYMYPGLCRMTSYDEDGNVAWVNIVDNKTGKRLTLNMKERKVDLRGGPYLMGGPPQAKGPFDAISEMLKTKPLELIGQRQMNGRLVNVVRVHLRTPDNKDRRLDFWFDAETKQLVGTSDIDIFDPAAIPDRNNPPGKDFGSMTILGSVTDNIVFNPPLDPARFSLEPPADFEVIPLPPTLPVTEDDLIHWLRASAQVNNDTFTDTAPTHRDELVRSAFNRVGNAELRARNTPTAAAPGDPNFDDPSDADQKLVELYNTYQAKRGNMPGQQSTPIEDFRNERTTSGSFRYAGKGVKLGDAARIVCWFQPKNTSKYRAVYGDLSVRNINPKELPLPID